MKKQKGGESLSIIKQLEQQKEELKRQAKAKRQKATKKMVSKAIQERTT